jgi:large subunit ribosomal protein L15
MVVRRKGKRRRGERTYHGSHKKWRGGGSRGGRGRAGMHKHKWSYTVKYEPEHFGKHGFKRPREVVKKLKSINLKELDKKIDELLRLKKIKKEKGVVKIDLKELGFDKLLGTGKIKHKVIVRAKYFSEKAKEKIEKAGGKIEVSE